mgnify:CR=1 FL=1
MTTAVRKPNVGCIMEQMEQPGEACLSLCRGKFLELLKEGRWEYVRRVNASGAVMIVAVTKEGELLLVEEYRVPLHARTVGLPAGISGDEGEESTLQSARRELEEETGYRADSWKWYPSIWRKTCIEYRQEAVWPTKILLCTAFLFLRCMTG